MKYLNPPMPMKLNLWREETKHPFFSRRYFSSLLKLSRRKWYMTRSNCNKQNHLILGFPVPHGNVMVQEAGKCLLVLHLEIMLTLVVSRRRCHSKCVSSLNDDHHVLMWSLFFTICWCLQRFSRQLKIFTIFHCSLHYNRTFWSITSRCKGQHLKLIFCVFIKRSENSLQCRSTVNGQASCWPRRTFFLVKQFKSFNYAISGVCWW